MFNSVKIRVEPDGGPKGKDQKCHIKDDGGTHPSAKVKDNKITLDAKAGPFIIEFKLTGNLDWAEKNPFLVKKGECPGEGEFEREQIWIQPPDGKKLTVLDLNSGKGCELHYRMNFADGTSCDPIIENGGGGIISGGE